MLFASSPFLAFVVLSVVIAIRRIMNLLSSIDWMVIDLIEVDIRFLNNHNHVLVYSGAPKLSLNLGTLCFIKTLEWY